MFYMQSVGYFDLTMMLWFMGESLCHYVLQQDSIRKLIHSTDLHFDVVTVTAFVIECFLGFGHKFQAHIIQVCAYCDGNAMGDWVGSPHYIDIDPKDWNLYNNVVLTGKHLQLFRRINPLNAELNPICHLLALLGAHHIHHVSRIRVNINFFKTFEYLDSEEAETRLFQNFDKSLQRSEHHRWCSIRCDNSEMWGINDAYPKNYNRKTLGNRLSRRAKTKYILGKGKVHRAFFGTIFLHFGFVNWIDVIYWHSVC